MQEERTHAIVLRTRAHGESDKIVTFLTRTGGKLPALQKEQSVHAGVLSTFLNFSPIFNSDFGQVALTNWSLSWAASVSERFAARVRTCQRFALASYMVELADVMVAGREAGQEIYALLLHSLAALEESSPLPSLFLSAFELRLLVEVGYAPNMSACYVCGDLHINAHNGRSGAAILSSS